MILKAKAKGSSFAERSSFAAMNIFGLVTVSTGILKFGQPSAGSGRVSNGEKF